LRPELLAGGLHQHPAISVQSNKLSLNAVQNLDRTERGIVADNVLQIESRLLLDNTGSLERRDSHE
jgi:hypothetical protein